MEIEYEEEFQPEYIKVRTDDYYKQEEKLQYYKWAISLIEEELECEDDDSTKLKNIKQRIEDLHEQVD